MEVISSACNEMKRCWRRRRRHQRLNGAYNTKKKLKIVRLGGPATRRTWKLRAMPRLQWKIISPIKLLTNFHEAYAEMMIRLVNKMGSMNGRGLLIKEKRVAKDEQISAVTCGEDLVDSRLVFEIYKRFAASRQFGEF